MRHAVGIIGYLMIWDGAGLPSFGSKPFLLVLIGGALVAVAAGSKPKRY